MMAVSGENLFEILAKEYNTPEKIQQFLFGFAYNFEEGGETVRSALSALKAKKAHCLEATLLAAAIAEQLGYPPIIVNMDSSDNICHAVFIYKTKTGWGSIGRSKILGLHGRKPKFRTIRELVMSYVDPFVDKTGDLTGYVILNLDQSGTNWRESKRNLRKLEHFIVYAKHTPVRTPKAHVEKLRKRYRLKGDLTNGRHWYTQR